MSTPFHMWKGLGTCVVSLCFDFVSLAKLIVTVHVCDHH